MTMKTCIVATGGGQFIVVFKDGAVVKRTDSFETWKAASQAILGWV